jgi:hypothetical protein
MINVNNCVVLVLQTNNDQEVDDRVTSKHIDPGEKCSHSVWTEDETAYVRLVPL